MENGRTMPVVPRIEIPPTIPSRSLVVLAAIACPPGTEKVTTSGRSVTSASAAAIMALGTGLMAGAPPAIVEAATETATARHFFEVCVAEGVSEPLRELCRRAAVNCRAHVADALDVEVHMVDFAGEREIARS